MIYVKTWATSQIIHFNLIVCLFHYYFLYLFAENEPHLNGIRVDALKGVIVSFRQVIGSV